MPNLLTTEAGLKLGPIVLETFFRHYLERKSETNDPDGSERSTNLRHDDLLWQEAFEIVKSFLNRATKYTVEDLQEFSNARIPTPPWIWVERVLVPMVSCDAAATHLIKALGGKEVTKRVVGGTKWWQVRGMRGVDCQWICQKSHLQEARKRKRAKEEDGNNSGPMQSPSSPRFPTIRKFSGNWARTSPSKSDGTPGSPGPGVQVDNESAEREESQDDIADMDGTRCMLYAHGGGYYFGSIDQERYCMQRYARKIKGRVFGVNYRLAPQYPFPCAIQDLLAAYLYLIDPPPNAKHAPISPELIVLGGDSAGGGLCLAVLQVMRDSGVSLPAGAVLISPWSDLTHSFPSTIHNTATDIIPPYGLCLHKPSVLWPPPPDEISARVRDGLRARFQKVTKMAVHVDALFFQSGRARHPQPDGEAVVAMGDADVASQEPEVDEKLPVEVPTFANGVADGAENDTPDSHVQDTVATAVSGAHPVRAGSALEKEAHEPDPPPVAGKPPLPWEPSQSFHLTVDGKPVTIDSQIQLYCPNSLLMHPLISPVLGYLGGLPPLFVIASDKEVLRDEIVYLAHKAAHPDRFGINEDSKAIYPPLQNIEKYQPTPVHLQVYDETAHVLPLFSFTTPAKYCYRAIALFTKHVTPLPKPTEPLAPRTITPESENPPPPIPENLPLPPTPDPSASDSERKRPDIRRISSALRSHSSLFTRRSMLGTRSRQASEVTQKVTSEVSREDSGDIAGSRFTADATSPRGPGTAGDPSVYAGPKEWPLGDIMVRERVSTNGVIRPLETESEIPALQLEPTRIGMINEAAARRYLEGTSLWSNKFAKTAKKIEMRRRKNLELAKGETIDAVKTMAQLQEHLFREQDNLEASGGYHRKESRRKKQADKLREKSGDAEQHTWGWAWALDGERPPPSSIVSRRDTVEARNLARVADLCVEQEESKMSGNMLWTVLVNFLTAHPSAKQKEEDEDEDDERGGEVKAQSEGEEQIVRPKASRILGRFRSLGGKKREASPIGR